jgi:hypothetical protein
MGVYGDMLLYWPEQRRALTLFDMKPKINGGWDKVVDQQGKLITQTITGVYQNTGGDSTVDSNGNLVHKKSLELWTETGELDDKFITYEGHTYRLKGDNQWKSEGGFYRYTLEKVVGNNGTESDNATWNISNNF